MKSNPDLPPASEKNLPETCVPCVLQFEPSKKFKTAIKHNIRTYANVVYKHGDIAFYNRACNAAWRGSGTDMDTDGQQILVKHNSFDVSMHS